MNVKEFFQDNVKRLTLTVICGIILGLAVGLLISGVSKWDSEPVLLISALLIPTIFIYFVQASYELELTSHVLITGTFALVSLIGGAVIGQYIPIE